MCISLMLFVYSIKQVYPIIIEVTDPLGLASNLTPAYWIGLAILAMAAIMAFFDYELKSDAIFILLLFAIGLFLVGIIVFGYENALSPSTYSFMGQAKGVLKTSHIAITTPFSSVSSLTSYYSWPEYYFLSTPILKTTGIDPGLFIKYWPLFWIVFFICIIYALGKRLELKSNYCFLLGILAMASWTWMYHFVPSTLGMLLYLLLFMLIITPRKTRADIVVVTLIFATLIITHGLTALAVLLPLLLISIYRRDGTLIVLFAVMFGAWYLFQAYAAAEAGIQQFLLHPLLQLYKAVQPETYELASALGRAVSRYSQLGRLALYIILVLGSAIMLLRGKITGPRRVQVISIFCWLVGIIPIIFLSYGEELGRAYLFAVVPSAFLVVLSLPSRKLLAILMCLLIALFPLANHTGDASWGQVLSSEMKGAEYIALKTDNQTENSYFYYYYGFMSYYNPGIRVKTISLLFGARLPQDVDPSILDEYDFVVMSKQGTNSLLYSWGQDPYLAWLQTDTGQKADLIYNNRYFLVYRNNIK